MLLTCCFCFQKKNKCILPQINDLLDCTEDERKRLPQINDLLDCTEDERKRLLAISLLRTLLNNTPDESLQKQEIADDLIFAILKSKNEEMLFQYTFDVSRCVQLMLENMRMLLLQLPEQAPRLRDILLTLLNYTDLSKLSYQTKNDIGVVILKSKNEEMLFDFKFTDEQRIQWLLEHIQNLLERAPEETPMFRASSLLRTLLQKTDIASFSQTDFMLLYSTLCLFSPGELKFSLTFCCTNLLKMKEQLLFKNPSVNAWNVFNKLIEHREPDEVSNLDVIQQREAYVCLEDWIINAAEMATKVDTAGDVTWNPVANAAERAANNEVIPAAMDTRVVLRYVCAVASTLRRNYQDRDKYPSRITDTKYLEDRLEHSEYMYLL